MGKVDYLQLPELTQHMYSIFILEILIDTFELVSNSEKFVEINFVLYIINDFVSFFYFSKSIDWEEDYYNLAQMLFKDYKHKKAIILSFTKKLSRDCIFFPLDLPRFSTKISRFINLMMATTLSWMAFFLSFAVALSLFCQNIGTNKSAVGEAARG